MRIFDTLFFCGAVWLIATFVDHNQLSWPMLWSCAAGWTITRALFVLLRQATQGRALLAEARPDAS